MCLSEKYIPQFAMQFPGLRMDQDLWARPIQSGCLSRSAFWSKCPVATTNEDWNEDLLREATLGNFKISYTTSPYLPLLTPLTASQHILPHLFPAKTLGNKSDIYSALNAKAGPWFWFTLDKIFSLKLLVFREKTNKTSPVATGNSLCTCLSSLGLEADKLFFLLSESPTTCLCAFPNDLTLFSPPHHQPATSNHCLSLSTQTQSISDLMSQWSLLKGLHRKHLMLCCFLL